MRVEDYDYVKMIILSFYYIIVSLKRIITKINFLTVLFSKCNFWFFLNLSFVEN